MHPRAPTIASAAGSKTTAELRGARTHGSGALACCRAALECYRAAAACSCAHVCGIYLRRLRAHAQQQTDLALRPFDN